jgi:hypothetical protein
MDLLMLDSSEGMILHVRTTNISPVKETAILVVNGTRSSSFLLLPVTAHFERKKPAYFLGYVPVFVQVPRPNGRLSLSLYAPPAVASIFLFSY